MTSHSVALNTDVLREIFEFAGFSDTAAGARLSRVSKTARSWLFPRIYRIMVVDNVSFLLLYESHQSQPPAFATWVRTIVIFNADGTSQGRQYTPNTVMSFHFLSSQAYNLDLWWAQAGTVELPEIHVIACCRGFQTRDWARSRDLGFVTRLYVDSGCEGAELRDDPESFSRCLSGLTHLGIRDITAKHEVVVRVVTAMLQSAKLQRLSLRLHTLALDLKTTRMWKTLQSVSMGDSRLAVAQSSDLVHDLTVSDRASSAGPGSDIVFARTRAIFTKYVSGEEDPWEVGEANSS